MTEKTPTGRRSRHTVTFLRNFYFVMLIMTTVILFIPTDVALNTSRAGGYGLKISRYDLKYRQLCCVMPWQLHGSYTVKVITGNCWSHLTFEINCNLQKLVWTTNSLYCCPKRIKRIFDLQLQHLYLSNPIQSSTFHKT